MTELWFAGNFCPRGAQCSLDIGELTPSNGPKIRTLSYFSPPETLLVGTIRLFNGAEESFNPEAWAKCDGGELEIEGHEQVFSIIGFEYGGEGRSFFDLPKIKLEDSSEGDYYICIKQGASPDIL